MNGAVRIAALSDVHAMADTLAAALAAARGEGYDVLLILGDLLTYGVAPAETIDLVADAVARDGAILIAGNHDQIYLDLATGSSDYLDTLPGWLRETVEWTARAIPPAAMTALPWTRRHAIGPLLAAHANPYSYGDWTYLNEAESMEKAITSLAEQGFDHGVFGHTHRHRRHDSGHRSVVTLPSLGQPRDRADPAPGWAMIDLDAGGMRAAARPVPFDAAAHRAAIRATGLSADTQGRLAGFFA